MQRIYEYDSAEPLLNGLHVLPNGTQLSLPMISSTSTESVYDPDVAIVSGTTFMAYTELVSGSSGFVTLVSGSSTRALGNVVWRQTSLPGTCEGNKIRQIGGVWKVLTTGTGQTTRVLNFNTGALEDTWNIGIQSSQGPCHPNITTVSGSGGSTEIYMLTFNGFSLPALWDARNITNLSTGAVGGSYQGNSEGQFVVLKCNQTEAGDEYPRIARTVPEAGAIDWKPYPFSSSALPPLGFTGVMTSGTFILGNPAIANNNVTAWDTTSPSPLKITTTGTTATISLSGTASDSVAGYIFP